MERTITQKKPNQGLFISKPSHRLLRLKEWKLFREKGTSDDFDPTSVCCLDVHLTRSLYIDQTILQSLSSTK